MCRSSGSTTGTGISKQEVQEHNPPAGRPYGSTTGTGISRQQETLVKPEETGSKHRKTGRRTRILLLKKLI